MTAHDVVDELHGYLRDARDALLWKLDGLREYDMRRPMTPSGTNLLGLVKHSACSHLRYFTGVFDRPTDPALSWLTSGTGPNAEFWVPADQTSAEIIEGTRRAWSLADGTIAELSPDAPGRVAWWGGEAVTLHHVLVHITAETQRHAGHADLLRELIDGSAGLLPRFDNVQINDDAQRATFLEQVEAAARAATQKQPTGRDQ